MSTTVNINSLTLDVNALQPIFDFVLRPVSQDDREDVKHDSIIRLMTALEKKGNKVTQDTLFSFAHSVVQKTVLDYFRKRNTKKRKDSILHNYSDDYEAIEDGGNPKDHFSAPVEEKGYVWSEIRSDYENNINQFTNQERKVIDYLLFTEEGRSMKATEITNILGLNKSHGSRAMSKLTAICCA